MADGFDPNKSQISKKSLVSFLDQDLTMNLGDVRIVVLLLLQVPGIGKVAIEKLKAAGVNCTFRLVIHRLRTLSNLLVSSYYLRRVI